MQQRILLIAVLLAFHAPHAFAVDLDPNEMADAKRWVAAKFEGKAAPAPPEAKLEVQREDDEIIFGRSGHSMQRHLMWEYSQLKIGKTVYTNGLYCHADCKIKVTLPAPGKRFTAQVGVDTNDRTKRGLGTVVFAVHVGGKNVFRSGVLKGGMDALPIDLELGGATEFVLEVSDAGDGIPYDYADWADAIVDLSDGRQVRLGGSLVGGVDAEPPFSFDYDGKSSRTFLKDWEVQRARRIDRASTSRTIIYRDQATGLEARLETVEYHDFPTVDWTVHFKNNGSDDTPMISNIRAVDTVLTRGEVGEFVLHHQKGSTAAIDELRPFETKLGPNATHHIATYGGRPTNVWPYFNIEWVGAGTIAVIAWPGQWDVDFTRDAARGLEIQGGQEKTHFKLLPGEEVRGPRIVLQFWRGDTVRAHNVWRSWMRAHNMPKPGGKLPATHWAGTSGVQFADMRFANEQNQMQFIDRYLEENLKIDYWWMDYAWFYHTPPDARYEADLARFPRGLRSITDHGRSKGVKGLVWFEPEHVCPGWRVHDQHPDWCLGKGDHLLINLGHPDALEWLIEDIDGTLKKEGIDLYRQDFNMEPLEFWRMTDTPDRQGMTEIRYIEGYLAFWDELLRRHPNMLIDSCASGGKRNDLETMRRGVPLWRSDYNNVAYAVFNYRIAPNEELPAGLQCQTYGLARWLPFFGTAARDDDEYIFRSGICPAIVSMWDVSRKDLDYDLLRRLTGEWKRVAHLMRDGDYYPLTRHSMENDVWMAWQFHNDESGEGVVQAFRRGDSPMESGRFQLGGLESDAQYAIYNIDHDGRIHKRGKELAEDGLFVSISEKPGSAIIFYKKAR
jgi:alpha-galactosidase